MRWGLALAVLAALAPVLPAEDAHDFEYHKPEKGSLGIELAPTKGRDGVQRLVVQRLQFGKDGSAPAIHSKGGVEQGDFLIALNGESVTGKRMKKVVAEIVALEPPRTMTFRPADGKQREVLHAHSPPLPHELEDASKPVWEGKLEVSRGACRRRWGGLAGRD